jgi:bacterial/archaeal transporter family-2 protein
MKLIYLISLFIGIFGILQAALNKQVSLEIGVTHATLIGMTITFIMGLALYFLIKENPSLLPPFYSIKKPITYFKWWYVIPAFLGFFIIFFLPQSIKDLGAVKVTILIIAGQIISSTTWDYFVDHVPLTLYKILGIFFAIVSMTFTLM